MEGGTVAAMLAISSSLITPGPLGICDTRPRADAPISTARAASSTLAMQQILTRGVRVASMVFLCAPLCPLWSTAFFYHRVRTGTRRRTKSLQVVNKSAVLLAVGYPDILDLDGVLEEPASLRHFRIEPVDRSEEHTSELQSLRHLVCR